MPKRKASYSLSTAGSSRVLMEESFGGACILLKMSSGRVSGSLVKSALDTIVCGVAERFTLTERRQPYRLLSRCLSFLPPLGS